MYSGCQSGANSVDGEHRRYGGGVASGNGSGSRGRWGSGGRAGRSEVPLWRSAKGGGGAARQWAGSPFSKGGGRGAPPVGQPGAALSGGGFSTPPPSQRGAGVGMPPGLSESVSASGPTLTPVACVAEGVGMPPGLSESVSASGPTLTPVACVAERSRAPSSHASAPASLPPQGDAGVSPRAPPGLGEPPLALVSTEAGVVAPYPGWWTARRVAPTPPGLDGSESAFAPTLTRSAYMAQRAEQSFHVGAPVPLRGDWSSTGSEGAPGMVGTSRSPPGSGVGSMLLEAPTPSGSVSVSTSVVATAASSLPKTPPREARAGARTTFASSQAPSSGVRRARFAVDDAPRSGASGGSESGSDSSGVSSGEVGLGSRLSARARPWFPSPAPLEQPPKRLGSGSRTVRLRRCLREWRSTCARRASRRQEAADRNRARATVCLQHWRALAVSRGFMVRRAQHALMGRALLEWRQETRAARAVALSREFTAQFTAREVLVGRAWLAWSQRTSAARGARFLRQHHKARRLRRFLVAWSAAASLLRERREIVGSVRRAFSSGSSSSSDSEPERSLGFELGDRDRGRAPVLRHSSELEPSSRRRESAPGADGRSTPVSSGASGQWRTVRVGLKSLSKGGRTPVSAVVWTERLEDPQGETYSCRKVELHPESLEASKERAQRMVAQHPMRISIRTVSVSSERPGELKGYGVGLEDLSRAVRAAVRGQTAGTSSESDSSERPRAASRPQTFRERHQQQEEARWRNPFSLLALEESEFALPNASHSEAARECESRELLPDPSAPRRRRKGKKGRSSGTASSSDERGSSGSGSSRSSRRRRSRRRRGATASKGSSEEESPALLALRAEMQSSALKQSEQFAAAEQRTQELRDMMAQATESLLRLQSEQRVSEEVRAVEARRLETHAEEGRAADARRFQELLEQEAQRQQRALAEQAAQFQEVVKGIKDAEAQESEGTPAAASQLQESQLQSVPEDPPSATTLDVGGRPSESQAGSGLRVWDFLPISIPAMDAIREEGEAMGLAVSSCGQAARRYRCILEATGQAGGKPPQCSTAWAKRQGVLVTGPLREGQPLSVPEPCARCSRFPSQRQWKCSTVNETSGRRDRTSLVLCDFCTASTWPGALHGFPEVRPPARQGRRGNGGDPSDDGDSSDGEDGGGRKPSRPPPTGPPGRSADHDARMRKEESSAQRDALKLVKEVMDPYAKALPGFQHTFGQLLRLMRQVEVLRRQQPVSYAMSLIRTVAVGKEIGLREGDPVLSEHSLLSEVVRYCFDTNSTEYVELRPVLQAAEAEQSLTLEKVIVPLAKLIVPERSQMVTLGPFLHRVRQAQGRSATPRSVREFWDGLTLAHDVVTMLSNHQLTSPVTPQEIFDIFLSGLLPDVMRQVFLIADRSGQSILAMDRSCPKARQQLLDWAIEAERELRTITDRRAPQCT